tara:strand:+ start:837 stop:1145 length:309 start_codon:yes stop_codon:yes gene_type:complete
MKLTFRETNDGQTNRIYVDEKFIGTVNVDLWTSKWNLKPVFTYKYMRNVWEVNSKFDSFYKAGKALAELYQRYNDYLLGSEEEDITDEIDMRGIFKSIGAGP